MNGESENIKEKKEEKKSSPKTPEAIEKKKEETEDLEVEEMIKGMPPEIRRIFKSVVMRSTIDSSNPVYEKINEKHIDKIIDYARDDEKDSSKLRSSNRFFNLVYTILGLAIFIFLIIYLLPRDLQLLVEILKVVVLFAAGVGSGYGLKSHLEKKSQE